MIFFFFGYYQAEQIYLKEMEVRDLQVSLKKLLEENRKLKNAKESDEYEKLVHLRLVQASVLETFATSFG